MSETPQVPDEAAKPQNRERRLRKRHMAHAVWSGVLGLSVALALGFAVLIGRDIPAPDWLQARIEEKLAEALPDIKIDLGDISLRIERSDLSPRVFFQNVTALDDTGLPFASLSEFSVRAAFPAALKGQFSPKKISLSGALIKLRRASDGHFDLTIGSALQSSEQAASLVELIDRIDQVLVQPELAHLREVSADSLTVLYEDARAGRAWTVDGGRMRLSSKDGQLAIGADFALLGGQDYATTLEMSYDSEIGSPAARLGLTLADAPSEDIASQTAGLAWMGALRAPISGSLRIEVDDDGDLGPLNATLQIGKGVVRPEDEARPIPFDGARAYFSYEPDENILSFNELTVKTEWFEASGEGRARMENAPGGWPVAMLGQFRLNNVKANPDGLYPEPITLERAELDMRLVFDPFRLDIGQLLLHEAGQTLSANGRADVGEDGWRIAVDANAQSLDLKEVLRVWPETAKEKTRTWIESNILGGEIHGARLAFRASEGERPNLHLGLEFSDTSLKFLKYLPPVEKGRGYVMIENERLIAVAEAGHVVAPQGGQIDVAGTVFEIPDMRVRGAPSNVTLATSSSVTAALSVLDQPPFEFLSKAGQPVALANGRAELSGEINVPLKQKVPASEIIFDVAGKITAVTSETLVEGRKLTSARLDLKAKPSGLSLSGKGRIDAIPFEGAWSMPLGQKGGGSQLTGQIELSEQFVKAFNIGLPPGSVSGKGSADIALDLKPDSVPSFELNSGLLGVGLNIAPLGWRKSAKSKATLAVRGTLGSKKTGAVPKVDRLSLKAAGLEALGSVKIKANGTLDRATFERVKAGNWLDAKLSLIGRGANATPGVEVDGGRLDLRNIPSQNSNASTGATPLGVKLDHLQVTQDIALKRFTGKFVSDRGLNGEFNGQLNGSALITGQTTPKAGKTAVRIKTSDAGAALNAAGLLKNASQGALTLTLDPRNAEGQYDGSLSIANIRLRNAPPALAVLSAASGIGLLEQMDGRGLMFNEVSSVFRLTPKTIIVSEGSAVGPSLGLSVDGYYDVASKTMDMQGVVSPFFAINGIGSILTRRGEGLIGFNYTLEGAAAAPQVKVNPLSLFTPGMFREIFRRPPPKLGQ
ncbi:AsmA-like C-terminal region-containing protein [Planktotalea sp.]|uniref:YhdP family protein n=1 Tax=Planktotalea sp. TaxID=2029877 RepID=UPI003D6C488C